MMQRLMQTAPLLAGIFLAGAAQADLGDLRLRAESSAYKLDVDRESHLGALLGAELALGLNSRSQLHLRSALSLPFFAAERQAVGPLQVLGALGTDLSVDRIPHLEPWIFAELQGVYAPDVGAARSVEQSLQIGVGLGIAVDFAVFGDWRLGLITRYSLRQALQPSAADGAPVSQLSLGVRVGPAIDVNKDR